MLKVLKIFLNADGTRPLLVLFSLLLASVCEAFGVSALVPVLGMISGQDHPGSMSSFGKALTGAMSTVGLPPTLGWLLVLTLCAFVLKSIISFFALSYSGISASRVSVRIRQRLVTALFEANWSFYAAHQSGSFANAMSNDATRAGDAYQLAAQFTSMLVQMVVYAVVALLIDWRLALLGFAVGGIMARMLSILIRISRRAGKKQTDRTRQLTVEVVDMLANIKPLKTMHRYAPLYASFQNNIRRLQVSLNTREISRQALNQIGDAVLAVAVGAIVYTSYTLWKTPIAELVVSGIIFLKIVSNVTRLQRFLQQSVEVESAYHRVTELVTFTEANRESWEGKQEPLVDADFRFDNVSFSHGDKQILKSVNLDIPARGISVLKGPSGAGKTTIIDLLIGLYRPSGGSILLGNVPLTSIDIERLRRRIGYVPQELNLLHSTIRENITLGDTSISDAAVAEALTQAGAKSFLESLSAGLDTNVGEMGGRLSGGQRQRISLARALVTNPAILILDEVTSALDPATEAEIIRNIAELGRRYTIIVITHHESWATIADRLYEVRGGEVQEIAAAPAP